MKQKIPPFTYDVYVISDRADVLIQAIKNGSTIVQLRIKDGSIEQIKKEAAILQSFRDQWHREPLEDSVSSGSGTRSFYFIINDDPTLVEEIGADGVHIGQTDWSVEKVRDILGSKKIIGKSTHNLEQGVQAHGEAVDYISVGPVFATPTKPGRAPVGLEYVQQAAMQYTLPFVTIGGIDLNNVDRVLDAGARTIGIVRAAADTTQLLAKVRLRKSFSVIINGKPAFLHKQSTLIDLLGLYNLDGDHVVMEVNESVIQKDQWNSFRLNEDDKIELIRFVGGG